MDWLRGGEVINETVFFMGTWLGGIALTTCDLTWKHMVKFVIMQCRTRHKMPTLGTFINELEGIKCEQQGWGG